VLAASRTPRTTSIKKVLLRKNQRRAGAAIATSPFSSQIRTSAGSEHLITG
jgi:hypothetical protein